MFLSAFQQINAPTTATKVKLNETNIFALSFTIRIEALKPHSKTLTNKIATNALGMQIRL